MIESKKEGAIGALLYEYKNVINDLKYNISDIKESDLTVIIDKEADHGDFVSMQSVLTHVIYWGYYYITMIDKHRGNANSPRFSRIYYDNISEYTSALDNMYDHTVNFFDNVSEAEMKIFNPEFYDIESLMQHAIVHVSRHRRQIKKFKEKLLLTN